MRKILLVITKAEVGGATVFVLNLARELKKLGFDVSVAFGRGNDRFLARELDKAKIPYFEFKNLKRTHNPFVNLLLIAEAKKFFKKNDFEIVHLNSSNSLPVGVGSKFDKIERKTIFTFHGLSMLDENYQKNNFLSKFYKFYFKFFLFFVDRFVFVSKKNLNSAIKTGLVKKEDPEHKKIVIPNGINEQNINFLGPKKAREEILPSSVADKFIIGSIARLDWAKNFEFVINIFDKILQKKPNAILVIIGEGSERQKYEKLIKEKGLKEKIILLGKIENASVLLKAFDIFLLCSRYEGMPFNLIEAIFADLPILASDVGGVPEIIPADTGQIFKNSDEADFLEKFGKLLNDKTKQKAVEANKKQKQKFSADQTARKYVRTYVS